MAFLGDLIVRLKADTADFIGGMDKASRAAEKAVRGVEKSASTMQNALAGLVGTVTVGAVTALVKHQINLGDEAFKTAQKIGTTVESYTALKYAAELADVSQQALTVSIQKLSTSILDMKAGAPDAVALFRALKIERGDLGSTETALLAIADRFKDMEDGATKSALAVKLFGRGGLDMIPFLNMGAAGIRQLMEEAKKLGIVWSTESAKGAEEFNDNLKRMSAINQGLIVQFAGSFLPLLIDVQKEMIASSTATGSFKSQVRDLVSSRTTVESWFEGAATGAAFLYDNVMLLKNAFEILSYPLQHIGRNIYTLAASQSILFGPGTWKEKTEALVQLRNESEKFFSDLEERTKKAQQPIELMQPKVTAWFAARRKRTDLEAIYGPGGEAGRPPSLQVDPEQLKAKVMTPAQELKLYNNTLQGLAKQIFALNNAGVEQLLIYETTKGGLVDLTEKHKQEVIEKGRLIDALTREKEERTAIHKALEAQAQLRGQQQAVVRDQLFRQAQQADDMQFELSLIGRSKREQEEMNAVRQVELELRRDLAALPKLEEGASEDQLRADAEAREVLIQRAQEHKAVVLDSARARQDAEHNWVTGAKDAFNEYIDAASNAAAMTKNLFSNAFQGMEDAVVRWAQTGKFSMKDLANNFIGDMARMAYRAATLPFFKGAQGWFDGLFGGSGGGGGGVVDTFGGLAAGGGPAFAGQGYWVGENGPEWFSPGGNGSISPAGGNVTVVQHIKVDSRSDMASVMAAMKTAKDAAVAAVNDQFRRGNRP